MTVRIVQKHPARGTREFELVDDAIEYRISSPLGDEELSVVLSVLSPEPVVDGSMMYFVSEVNREALIKLFVDLPDARHLLLLCARLNSVSGKRISAGWVQITENLRLHQIRSTRPFACSKQIWIPLALTNSFQLCAACLKRRMIMSDLTG